MNARTDSDLETAFTTFSQQHVGAVLVGNSTLYNRRTEQLAALAAGRALPAIFPLREYALAGGLMSYGSSVGYACHEAGVYTGRILKGEKPADLPVLHFRTAKPHRLLDSKHGPLIAIRLHILTRKTLGGLETDLDGKVFGLDGDIIPGLYAIGEAAGFGGGGMHGYGSLEGTFLGGCLFSGLQAGTAAAKVL
jgi:predicted oxidoreductase